MMQCTFCIMFKDDLEAKRCSHELQEQKVNEVHSGGLSSYSLVNMVIAHLQAEGYGTGLEGVTERKVADPAWDLGELLWGFLMRFGKAFDYVDQAVSINKVRQPQLKSHRVDHDFLLESSLVLPLAQRTFGIQLRV